MYYNIYIYIERERYAHIYISICLYIYIYIYTYRANYVMIKLLYYEEIVNSSLRKKLLHDSTREVS